jgi:hypothetical protein
LLGRHRLICALTHIEEASKVGGNDQASNMLSDDFPRGVKLHPGCLDKEDAELNLVFSLFANFGKFVLLGLLV